MNVCHANCMLSAYINLQTDICVQPSFDLVEKYLLMSMGVRVHQCRQIHKTQGSIETSVTGTYHISLFYYAANEPDKIFQASFDLIFN